MKNFKMKIEYDGTKYKGWQIQKSTPATIQGKLQSVLESIVKHPVEVIGSGRTDAGVHAKGQVANVHLCTSLGVDELLRTINSFLPEDIAVTSIEEVDERFHSRFHAKDKIYRYRIHTSPISNVFERKYVYVYQEPLDCERMRKAAQWMCGTHDFAAFCGNKHMKKTTVRTVYEITIQETEREIIIDYRGDGFLQNMIRIMTGTLIEVGNGTKKPDAIRAILESKDRTQAGYTAPAQGLALMEVHYE